MRKKEEFMIIMAHPPTWSRNWELNTLRVVEGKGKFQKNLHQNEW